MEFVCRLGTPDGRVVEEVRQATTVAVLRGDLERSGYYIFEVKRRGLRLAWPARRGRIKAFEFMVFNREMASLLKAGLPLLSALDLLLERQRDPKFAEVLRQVRDKVKAGEELSQAFRSFGDLFPPLYSSTLMAGERSGELEGVLRRFIRFQKLVLDTRKKVTSSLVYPAVLVLLSMVMISIMIVVVIPRFQGFYEGMDVKLPLITRALLGISTTLRANGWWILIVLVVGGVSLLRSLRTEVGGRWRDRLLLRIPIIGAVFHRFAISEFCRSLATLLGGGFPLVPSLEVSTDSLGNRFLRDRLAPVSQEVREGASLHVALLHTGVVADLAIDMVKVGETTGALAEMLQAVSDFFDEEIEVRLERLLSLIEPIMLIFMALIVAMLLLAMYMPMFSAMGNIQ